MVGGYKGRRHAMKTDVKEGAGREMTDLSCCFSVAGPGLFV